MRKKNVYLVIDTETVGGAANPTGTYNYGGRIITRDIDTLASFNYLCANVYQDINKDDYAKKNFWLYEQMIEDGEITVVPDEETAINNIKALCDYYGVTHVMAYNSEFDFTKTRCAELLEGRMLIDLFLMAVQTITRKKSYSAFCHEHGFRSRSKNSISVSTTAQTMYAFITGNPEYQEEHTAGEDARIEAEIFYACLATHQKFTQGCHMKDCKDKKYFPRW